MSARCHVRAQLSAEERRQPRTQQRARMLRREQHEKGLTACAQTGRSSDQLALGSVLRDLPSDRLPRDAWGIDPRLRNRPCALQASAATPRRLQSFPKRVRESSRRP
jgi:hypothetical protein